MAELWLQLGAIFLLLIAGGIISSWRYALLTVRKSQLEEAMRTGDPRAATALQMIEQPLEINLNVQIAQTILTIAAAAIGAAFLCDHVSTALSPDETRISHKLCQWISLVIIIAVISFLRIWIGEVIPRKLAEKNPLKLALRGVRPLRLLNGLSIILTAPLNFASEALLWFFRGKPMPPSAGAAEEKIIDLVEMGAKSGQFDQTEQDLIKSVFDFTDTTVSQCMTPRIEISAIDINWPTDKALQFIREEGYSRFPVFENDLDHIVGILFTRDVINLLYDQHLIIIQDLIRPPYFVPDSLQISELLKDMQARQAHIAIVLDEFGGTAGIITIEDILEELVGEIQDEFDEEEESLQLAADDFNERFHAALPEEQGDTIGGLIFTMLGELPDVQNKIIITNIEFTILSLDGNRIASVLARRIKP
jgi:putative hemolysin